MSAEFAPILRGLMANRRLTRRALSRASGHAESTINQLMTDLSGQPPRSVEDLLVIAGLPVDYDPTRPGPYLAASEIGSLVAAASHLTPEEVGQLVREARRLKVQNP